MLALLIGLGVVRCNSAIQDGSKGLHVLTFLEIHPNNSVLTVDLNTQSGLDFQVIARFADETSEDVTDRVMLTNDNSAVGAFSGHRFTTAAQSSSKVDFTNISTHFELDGQTAYGVGKLTVVSLRKSGLQPDFLFVLPHNAPQQDQPLSFGTNIQSLDSFFAVDTTGSMAPPINGLIASLQNTIIPGVQAAAAKDAAFGVGAIEDFPVDPFGVANAFPPNRDDQPFILLSPINRSAALAQSAVAALLKGGVPRGDGNDLPEGQLEALFQIATGLGNVVQGVVDIPPATAPGIGGVGFRKGALPVITLITDAMFHTKSEAGQQCTTTSAVTGSLRNHLGNYTGAANLAAHTRSQTLAALNKICAKVIGVSTLLTSSMVWESDPQGICNATDDLIKMAKGTGAMVPPEAWDLPSRPAGCAAGKCCTGLNSAGENPDASGLCPLVFKIAQNGGGLGAQVTGGITQLARFATFDVTSQTAGGTIGDNGAVVSAGHTTADFIKSIIPFGATVPPPPPTIPPPAIVGGKFTKVTPGTTVHFTINAQNDFQPEAAQPQVFRATIRILAGGCADLDEREVIILIPPATPVIG